jgi:enediyne biosynthesis protein E4
VGGRVISSNYGQVPKSYLLVNDGKGKFADKTAALAPELSKAGMVTDALWADVDNDKDQDLVVVGEWMGIQIFENKKGKLDILPSKLDTQKGFWHSIEAADFDRDGDVDFVVGNLGTNTKYIKQANPKLRMYANDMDGNGRMEQIIAYEKGDKWYPAASRDDLSRMAPGIINRRFPEYTKYAGKPIEDLFEKAELHGPNALEYEVNTFESVYIENKGKGEFDVKPLPREAQMSKVFAMRAFDVDKDGYLDILLGGNLYGVSTYQGRYDASYGLVLKGSKNGFQSIMPTDAGFVLDGEVRDIKPFKTAQGTRIVVVRNNKVPQVFKTIVPFR